MYETYSMMLNSRRSTQKEDEHASLQNQKNQASIGVTGSQQSRADVAKEQRLSKKLSWVAYIAATNKDMYFLNVRMYERPPMMTEEAAILAKKEANGFELRQIREHDLIVMSH